MTINMPHNSTDDMSPWDPNASGANDGSPSGDSGNGMLPSSGPASGGIIQTHDTDNTDPTSWFGIDNTMGQTDISGNSSSGGGGSSNQTPGSGHGIVSVGMGINPSGYGSSKFMQAPSSNGSPLPIKIVPSNPSPAGFGAVPLNTIGQNIPSSSSAAMGGMQNLYYNTLRSTL